jgi:hypothetical protein
MEASVRGAEPDFCEYVSELTRELTFRDATSTGKLSPHLTTLVHYH